MRTAADKFARTLADNKFGAPFNWSPPTGQPNQYDRIITSAKGICTVIRHERYKDKQRDIHFDLVEDLRLNALAFATKTIDFVGILAGTVLIIRDLFNRMLAHPEVLPNIGESTTEIADGITIPNLNNYAQYLDPQCFPKCAIRAQYADILTETALKFIAGHEMGHLLNGHCELRSQNAVNILCLERDDDDKPCGLDNLSLQTLELDADSVGAFWCWRSEYFIHTILPDLISEFPNSRASFEAAYATPAATCSTLLFALWTVFRLFDDRNYDKDNLLEGKHPASGIRAMWTSNSLREHPDLQPLFGITPTEFMQISQNMFSAAEKALALVTGTDRLPTEYYMLAVSEEALSLLRAVHARWSELRPSLEVLKRGGTLSD